MTFRITLLSLFLVLGFTLHAQNNAQNSTLNSLESSEFESVLDSIEQQDSTLEKFPAENLYKRIWDCSNIKYPKADFFHKNDTIVFTLVGPNDHPFVQPFKGRVISKFGPTPVPKAPINSPTSLFFKISSGLLTIDGIFPFNGNIA